MSVYDAKFIPAEVTAAISPTCTTAYIPMYHEPGPVRGDCTVAFRREVALVQTILSALAPIVFTLLLGFVAAWRHDFGPKEASVLDRMVLLYAVPLALFVGMVGTPRADLVQDIAFVVVIFVAIVGLYALVFLLFHFVLRFSLSESVLAALTASAPAVPFMGPAILGDLFGKASAITIAIAALIINLIVVPITILGLALGRTPIETIGSPTTRHSAFTEKLLETVKEPIVWAPVFAFVSHPQRRTRHLRHPHQRHNGAVPRVHPNYERVEFGSRRRVRRDGRDPYLH